MGFEGLLGNERLKENLRVSVGRGRTSHFYLISGPKGSGKHTLAKLLSAAILCQDPHAPCLCCNTCRKVMAGTHPDCITVSDPDHKNVPVQLVKDARADMYVMPNEGSHKIYLFPQSMGIEGQNALLKILEEPPKYGVFLLLTENPEQLLPTVRSRCTPLQLLPLSDQALHTALTQAFPNAEEDSIRAAISRSGGYLGQAKEALEEGLETSEQTEGFVRSFAKRDDLGMLQVLVSMERWKRDVAIAEWQNWVLLLENALVCHCGMQTTSPLARQLYNSRSSAELMQAIGILKKMIEYAQGNVSVAAICGHLQWALR